MISETESVEQVAFRVNGNTHTTDASVLALPLAEWLREYAGAVDVKVGCAEGVCGACMVLVDGVATNSCLVPVIRCDGSDIRTPGEVAVNDARGRRISRSLAHADSSQCGYCVGGILCSAAGQRCSSGDLDQVLDSHLCRCGGYTRHAQALREAATDD